MSQFPTCEPVQIKQDSVIGQAESVNIVNTISKSEDPSQVGNMSIVKRIAFRKKLEPKLTMPLSRRASNWQRKENVTVPVRIFNPTCEPVQIKQDSVIGQAESVNIVNTISKSEDPSQVGNMSIVKRIAFQKKLEPKLTMPLSRRASNQQRKEIARRIHVDEPRAPVPEHLRELYEKSAKGKSEEQKRKIHNLFLDHQNVFAKDEFDIG